MVDMSAVRDACTLQYSSADSAGRILDKDGEVDLTIFAAASDMQLSA
jgi:hypothetical protein